MATVPLSQPPPPTPPPLPPPSSGDQSRTRPPPSPQHAAKPFYCTDSPVQETTPSQEAVPDVEGALAAPLLPGENGESQSPPTEGQDDSPSDDEDKSYRAPPETELAPQTTEQQDEAPIQMDEAGEN